MAKFTFSNDTVLDINGEVFEIDSTDLDLIKRIENFRANAEAEANKMTKAEKGSYVKALEDAIKFATDAIDEFLGERASERIFKDTPISLVKALNVVNYISQEISNSRMKSVNKFNPNRAQRRNSKKK